jgi:hypothetical protein
MPTPPDRPAPPPAKARPGRGKPSYDHPWSRQRRAARARQEAATAAKRPKPEADPV